MHDFARLAFREMSFRVIAACTASRATRPSWQLQARSTNGKDRSAKAFAGARVEHLRCQRDLATGDRRRIGSRERQKLLCDFAQGSQQILKQELGPDADHETALIGARHSPLADIHALGLLVGTIMESPGGPSPARMSLIAEYEPGVWPASTLNQPRMRDPEGSTGGSDRTRHLRRSPRIVTVRSVAVASMRLST